jgi:hypothetical protein
VSLPRCFKYNNQAQIVNIPDVNFKDALVNENVVDTTGEPYGDVNAGTISDEGIQVIEAEAVISLHISYQEFSCLEGIQSLTNIEGLSCFYNQ